MIDGLSYNDKTADWLNGQGFMVTTDSELKLDTGTKNPHFLCKKNGHSFWVEVKTVDYPKRHEFQKWCRDEFDSRKKIVTVPGEIYVMVTLNIPKKDLQKDIRKALSMVNKVLSNTSLSTLENTKHYVVIPKDPVPSFNEFIQIKYETNEGKELLYAVKSECGKYSRAYLGDSLKFGTDAIIINTNGNISTEMQSGLHELGLYNETNFRISIELMGAEDEFRIRSIQLTDVGVSNNVEIFRDRSSKASDQFKSANKQVDEKPGIVIFHHDNIYASDEKRFISAFYGDLAVLLPKDNKEKRLLSYENNGFWNKNKNKTVSAAMYFAREEKPILVHNHWAKNPLPRNLFVCKEFFPKNDGTFEETDCE